MTRRTKTTILPSENQGHGFYGTVALERGEAAAESEWKKMSRRCIGAGLSPASCRDFLDSRMGRHLADAVLARTVSALELKRNFINRWKREGGEAWSR